MVILPTKTKPLFAQQQAGRLVNFAGQTTYLPQGASIQDIRASGGDRFFDVRYEGRNVRLPAGSTSADVVSALESLGAPTQPPSTGRATQGEGSVPLGPVEQARGPSPTGNLTIIRRPSGDVTVINPQGERVETLSRAPRDTVQRPLNLSEQFYLGRLEESRAARDEEDEVDTGEARQQAAQIAVGLQELRRGEPGTPGMQVPMTIGELSPGARALFERRFEQKLYEADQDLSVQPFTFAGGRVEVGGFDLPESPIRRAERQAEELGRLTTAEREAAREELQQRGIEPTERELRGIVEPTPFEQLASRRREQLEEASALRKVEIGLVGPAKVAVTPAVERRIQEGERPELFFLGGLASSGRSLLEGFRERVSSGRAGLEESSYGTFVQETFQRAPATAIGIAIPAVTAVRAGRRVAPQLREEFQSYLSTTQPNVFLNPVVAGRNIVTGLRATTRTVLPDLEPQFRRIQTRLRTEQVVLERRAEEEAGRRFGPRAELAISGLKVAETGFGVFTGAETFVRERPEQAVLLFGAGALTTGAVRGLSVSALQGSAAARRTLVASRLASPLLTTGFVGGTAVEQVLTPERERSLVAGKRVAQIGLFVAGSQVGAKEVSLLRELGSGRVEGVLRTRTEVPARITTRQTVTRGNVRLIRGDEATIISPRLVQVRGVQGQAAPKVSVTRGVLRFGRERFDVTATQFRRSFRGRLVNQRAELSFVKRGRFLNVNIVETGTGRVIAGGLKVPLSGRGVRVASAVTGGGGRVQQVFGPRRVETGIERFRTIRGGLRVKEDGFRTYVNTRVKQISRLRQFDIASVQRETLSVLGQRPQVLLRPSKIVFSRVARQQPTLRFLSVRTTAGRAIPLSSQTIQPPTLTNVQYRTYGQFQTTLFSRRPVGRAEKVVDAFVGTFRDKSATLLRPRRGEPLMIPRGGGRPPAPTSGVRGSITGGGLVSVGTPVTVTALAPQVSLPTPRVRGVAGLREIFSVSDLFSAVRPPTTFGVATPRFSIDQVQDDRLRLRQASRPIIDVRATSIARTGAEETPVQETTAISETEAGIRPTPTTITGGETVQVQQPVPIVEPISRPISRPIIQPVPAPAPSPIPTAPVLEKPPETTIAPLTFELGKGRPAPRAARGQAFNAFVREKGKFVKVNEKPLPKNRAMNLASDIVDNTPAVSFRLKKTTGKVGVDAISWLKKNQFRMSKREKGVFVELRKYRIDTEGEVKGIPVKGYLKRMREARFGGFGGIAL